MGLGPGYSDSIAHGFDFVYQRTDLKLLTQNARGLSALRRLLTSAGANSYFVLGQCSRRCHYPRASGAPERNFLRKQLKVTDDKTTGGRGKAKERVLQTFRYSCLSPWFPSVKGARAPIAGGPLPQTGNPLSFCCIPPSPVILLRQLFYCTNDLARSD